MARLPYGSDEPFGMEQLNGGLQALGMTVRRRRLHPHVAGQPVAGDGRAEDLHPRRRGRHRSRPVTGGVMLDSAGPPPFLVNGPFAFTVSDRQTGTILFLGSVHDPRG